MRIPWDGGEWVALLPRPNDTNKVTAQRLDEDEVSQIDTLGGRQETTIINESGLYNVILRSDKPEAV